MPPTPGFWGAIFEVFFDIGSDAIGFEVFWSQDGAQDAVSGAQDVPRPPQDPPRPSKTPKIMIFSDFGRDFL